MSSRVKRISFLVTLVLSTLGVAQKRTTPAKDTGKDPIPQAPEVQIPPEGVVEQAGVGNGIGYARAGVLEIGGSANFAKATGQTELGIAPTLGYFFLDNWQASAILNWSYVKAGTTGNHVFTLLVEPSFHYPATDQDFLFMGLGMGYGKQSGAGGNGGFAFAPRIGYKRLIGRSGVITTDIRALYSTGDIIQTNRGTALTVNSATSLGAGFSVLW
jgi:hypothetical protein